MSDLYHWKRPAVHKHHSRIECLKALSLNLSSFAHNPSSGATLADCEGWIRQGFEETAIRGIAAAAGVSWDRLTTIFSRRKTWWWRSMSVPRVAIRILARGRCHP